MNCISGSILLIFLLACSACGAPASGTDANKADSQYYIHYTISPDPDNATVAVTLELTQSHGQLKELSFAIAKNGPTEISADGEADTRDGRFYWQPNRTGGRLHWKIKVPHERSSGGFDAWLQRNWGIFRAEDIIPRARTRTLKGARSKTTMTFQLPIGWSAVSEYSSLNSRIRIDIDRRRFDQPRGWIAIGRLGIRRETIAGIRIAIVGPEGESVRRLDMLALLNWTLPELTALLPGSIRRLTVFSAGDPMWRGGLSAPASIFIHADRPLISENATSTLLHEVMHVALHFKTKADYDWISEGLAEYYSLKLLRRGGAITARRHGKALERLSEWADEAELLCQATSSGATTALAIMIFRDLNEEIISGTEGRLSLDDLLTKIADSETDIGLDTLRKIVSKLLGRTSNALRIDNLPGCEVKSTDHSLTGAARSTIPEFAPQIVRSFTFL